MTQGRNKAGYYERKTNGHLYPSVTKVLNIIARVFLYFWYGKHGTAKCQQIKAESNAVGTWLHKFIEAYYDGTYHEIKLEPKYLRTAKNFLAFAEAYNPKMLHAEVEVFSDRYQYAGTFDGVVVINTFPLDEVEAAKREGREPDPKTKRDILIVIDWKSSNQFDPMCQELQVQAYWQALKEMIAKKEIKLDKLPEELWLVRFDKIAEFIPAKDIHRYKPNKRSFKEFLAALILFRRELKCSKKESTKIKKENKKNGKNASSS